MHFETVLLFVRSAIAIRLSLSDAEQFVGVVFVLLGKAVSLNGVALQSVGP